MASVKNYTGKKKLPKLQSNISLNSDQKHMESKEYRSIEFRAKAFPKPVESLLPSWELGGWGAAFLHFRDRQKMKLAGNRDSCEGRETQRNF